MITITDLARLALEVEDQKEFHDRKVAEARQALLNNTADMLAGKTNRRDASGDYAAEIAVHSAKSETLTQVLGSIELLAASKEES